MTGVKVKALGVVSLVGLPPPVEVFGGFFPGAVTVRLGIRRTRTCW
jgi:hypothetical protein